MYVRLNLDKSGRIYLQQLLTLDSLDGKNPQPTWENVPMTGSGTTQSLDSPIGMNCGVFMIKERINRASQTFISTHLVSALSISNIVGLEDGKTRINVQGQREHFIVNVDQINVIKLLTTMLSKFMIINIDVDGNITNI